MLLLEFFHLSVDGLLQVFFNICRFKQLLSLDHASHSVGPIKVLDGEEYFLLLTHLDQVLAITLPREEGLGYLLLV